MKEIISNSGGLLAVILLVMMFTNALLTGLHKALEYIKDKTANKVDNWLYRFTGKASEVVLVVIDIISANKKHK